MRRSLPLSLYRLGTILLEPVAAGLLGLRRRRGKEDPARLPERRGLTDLPRPAGTIVWLHGASVGETVTLLPLVERLQARGLTVLVTSGTVTSARLLGERLPPGAIHQFLPLDVPRYMRRFLSHWQPALGLICESEIWPNLVIEAKKRAIPLVLVNARMSERSFARWSKAPQTARYLLSRFESCLAQSRGDGERLEKLGAPRVTVAGNMKFDVPAPPADADTLALLDGTFASRPVWVAASTHAGEDEMVIEAHRAVVSALPRLLTVIVPRHPHRGEDIADIARAEGLSVALRTRGEAPHGGVEVYVADTVGELGLFYRLAQVAFVGGTLVPVGGHNPIEPAKLGCALLHGPHVHNATEIFDAFDEGGGAREVIDAHELATGVRALLSDTAGTRQAARAAGHTAAEFGGALNRTLLAIEPMLLRASLDGREN